MDTSQIGRLFVLAVIILIILDWKKMKYIVKDAVYEEDTDYLEKIDEKFLEFLKENTQIMYNNKSKLLKTIPWALILDQKSIQIKYIYNRNHHSNSDFIM